jgi:hypothetical protein
MSELLGLGYHDAKNIVQMYEQITRIDDELVRVNARAPNIEICSLPGLIISSTGQEFTDRALDLVIGFLSAERARLVSLLGSYGFKAEEQV